ncbi:MAG: hypothetical protein CMH52_00970 [Myxococcales bacterium]|nr:hypothetical protein [Myxococcales bacterium]
MTDQQQTPGGLWPARLDPLIGGLLALGILTAAATQFGVWEPWEANISAVANHMVDNGRWLEVNVGQGSGAKEHAVSDLPFGYWPVAASVSLLGTSTLSLRLAGLIFGASTLFFLMLTVRRFAGRAVAWWSAIILLSLPLFCFHHWLALGQSTTLMATTTASLAFIHSRFSPGRAIWIGAWVLTALSGLSGGVPALAIPMAVLFTLFSYRIGRDSRSTVMRWSWAVVALLIVGLGWWRASLYMPGDAALESLFLWADNIHSTTGTTRPSFNAFVHQIGFGLFPFGALLPLALLTLLWSKDTSNEDSGLGAVLFVWILAGFIAPALGAGYSHFGIFLAAPGAAFAIAIYLGRMPKQDANPVLAIIAVLILALLDSNLKHETRLFADTIVGTSIDSFPAYLPYWKIARFLNFALIAYILLYQARLHHWLSGFVQYFAYPVRRRPYFDLAIFAMAALVPLLLLQRRTTLDPLVRGDGWGNLQFWFRRLIIALILGLITYISVWLVCYIRNKMLKGRTSGLLSKTSRWVRDTIDGRSALSGRITHLTGAPMSTLILMTVLMSWLFFFNVPIASELSTNFSQKEVLNVYKKVASGDEKLYTYRLSNQTNSFYSRDLPKLKTSTDFAKLAKGTERFFALIPRKDLASVNVEFRRATGRTLPVLDDRGSRYFLVSNKIDEGVVDKNPITNALIDELPDGVTKVNINFEDKIELVAWKIEPSQPKSGSPAELHMFWKSTAKTQSTWKVFVHIDAPGQRIHGDHDPVAGLFPTRNWKKGDLVRDIHKINIKRTITPARFTFYAGLYRSSTRMKIKSGKSDKQNRARLGSIQVR